MYGEIRRKCGRRGRINGVNIRIFDIRSVVITTTTHREGPVIFRDAAPKGPDPRHGEKSEEGLEQSTVDLATRGTAQVGADHIVEDLANCKEQCGTSEIHCYMVSTFFSQWTDIRGSLTHWPEFAQDPKNQHTFQDVVEHHTDEREELV